MEGLLELLADNESVTGRLVTSAFVVVTAAVVASVAAPLVGRRFEEPSARYYAKKLTRYAVGLVALVLLAILWRAFAGRAGVVVGLAAAGLAFAMQEVVGAVAGWFNILSGRIFRIGDRILQEEVSETSASADAVEAMRSMTDRYPVARTDVEPRVFMRATDNWNELSARFIVPVTSARQAKDAMTRRILERFAQAGIDVASETFDVTVHLQCSDGGERARRPLVADSPPGRLVSDEAAKVATRRKSGAGGASRSEDVREE